MAPKTPVLKLNSPLSCKPPAAIVSESARVAFEQFAKPQVKLYTQSRHEKWCSAPPGQ